MHTEPLPSPDQPDSDRSRANEQDSPATDSDSALTERLDPIPDAFEESAPPKRSRVLPMALAAVGVLAAGLLGYAVVSSIIAGVASTSATESTPPPPAPTSLPASPTPAPTPSTLPVAGDRPIAGVNECVDVVGDGGVADLDVVRLEEAPLGLVATYHLAKEPEEGDVGVGIVAQSDDGELVYQIAAHWVDGDLEQYFVYDVSGDSTSLSLDSVQTQGSVIATLLPDDIIATLGDDWSWYAFSVAEGQDADGCPSDRLIPFVDQSSNGSGNSGDGSNGRDRDRD